MSLGRLDRILVQKLQRKMGWISAMKRASVNADSNSKKLASFDFPKPGNLRHGLRPSGSGFALDSRRRRSAFEKQTAWAQHLMIP